jgi:ferredoxin
LVSKFVGVGFFRVIARFLLAIGHDLAEHRKMKLVIEADRCQGHNRCYAIVPELVDVDDLGNAFVLGDGVVSDSVMAKARLAVANCPERAITLQET